MSEIRIRIHIQRVDNTVLVNGNGRAAGMSWDVGVAFAEALQRAGRAAREYAGHVKATGDWSRTTDHREEVQDLVITVCGPAVFVELGGLKWFECNYKTVPELVQGLLGHARAIEELAKADQIADDEAFLLRTGIPVGLATDPRIKKEALKRAEDVKFDGMVEPTCVFYPPTIIQHDPVPAIVE